MGRAVPGEPQPTSTSAGRIGPRIPGRSDTHPPTRIPSRSRHLFNIAIDIPPNNAYIFGVTGRKCAAEMGSTLFVRLERKTKTKMKTMKFAGLTCAVALMVSTTVLARPALLWPMLLSIHPLFAADKDTTFEPGLLGRWRGGGDTVITFERAGTNAYIFTITPARLDGKRPPAKQVYSAHLVPIEKDLVLDLIPADELVLPHEGFDVGAVQGHFWRAHSFMLIRQTPTLLQLSPVDYRAFSTTPGVESMGADGRLLLLGPPATLRTLFEKQLKDNGLRTGGTFDYSRENTPPTAEETAPQRKRAKPAVQQTPSAWHQYMAERPVAADIGSKSSAIDEIREHAKSLPVPLPASTPYDDSPGQRKQYLAGFTSGWAFALSDDFLKATIFHPGQPHFWVEGYNAGTRAFTDPFIKFLKHSE